MIRLDIDAKLHRQFVLHLLPRRCRTEQAAFLFGATVRDSNDFSIVVMGSYLVRAGDLICQESNYLELCDRTRARLIKQAHELNACLVEAHSHPGPWPAAFSYTDIQGLKETAPHMQWRLPGRPYVAMVVASSGFDSLVWLPGSSVPVALSELRVGERVSQPTNISVGGWS